MISHFGEEATSTMTAPLLGPTGGSNGLDVKHHNAGSQHLPATASAATAAVVESGKPVPELKDQKAQLQTLLTTVFAQLKSQQNFSKKTDLQVFEALDPNGSKDKIIKISHELKSRMASGMTGVTALIHLDKFDSKLFAIKINAFRGMESFREGEWDEDTAFALQGVLSVALVYKNNTREYYLVRGKLTDILKDLRELAATMEIAEFAVVKGYALHVGNATLRSAAMWDGNWEKKSDGVYYDKINDPLILEQFTKQVLPLERKPGEPLKVLDIGAGKGRLANKLIEFALQQQISIDYTLLEPSKIQIDLARQTLEKYATAKNCKITFIHSTLQNSNLAMKAHCVLSSGGPLNINIVTRDDAIANVKRMSALLLPHGVFIATGRTPLLVKAKHFSQTGLDVLSYAKPLVMPELSSNEKVFEDKLSGSISIFNFFNHLPLYVCKKKTDQAIKEEQAQAQASTGCQCPCVIM